MSEQRMVVSVYAVAIEPLMPKQYLTSTQYPVYRIRISKFRDMVFIVIYDDRKGTFISILKNIVY